MRALLATLLFCGLPGTAQAHAIHSTLTEITRTADGMVTVRVRTFVDDFSTAVARHVKGTPRKDYAVADVDAARYLGATMLLTDSRGASVPLTFVSQQRTGDVVWLELRATSTPLSGASIRNAMLFEVHDDQVNIVKTSYDRTSFTTLFSSGDRAKKLP
ncbi:MAG: DUF6702 family protein [Gemmatimonadaceae bacterium]